MGSLWFGPKTFFPRWWQALGKSADDQPGGSNMALVFGVTFLAIVVQALVLAVVISLASSAMGELGWFGGLATGALMGVGVGGWCRHCCPGIDGSHYWSLLVFPRQ